MKREANYWKSLVMKENDDLSLINNALKARLLRAMTKKLRSESQDVNKTLAELQSKYCE